MDEGQVLAGRYELEQQIGSGGAAVVWRARDRELGRTVAVKLLRPDLEDDAGTVARFRREAQAAAAINHENAVAIYDIGEHAGHVFLVMEHVNGPALADIMRDGALRPAAVVALGYQAAAALGAAHDRGLVHRDVKPANILVNRDGQTKVADFGIAKAVDDEHTTLTRAGTVIGTVAYLAPEQIRGDDVDPRTDVYALGLVLHEGLTGAPPFGSGTPAELTARRLASDPPALSEARPDLPEDLALTIEKASRREPDQRFANGRELAAALERLLADEPAVLLRPLARRHAPRSRDRTDTLVLTPVPPSRAAETVPVEQPEAPRARQGQGSSAAPERSGGQAGRPAAGTSSPAVAEGASPPASAPRHAAAARDDAPPPPARTRDASEQDGADRGEASAFARVMRSPAALGVGLLLLALVLISVLGGGDATGGGDGAAGEGGDVNRAQVVDARDFDPFGDGEEHREELAAAYDRQASTAWTTERYDSAAMGGLKPGVGIWFDLGEARPLARVNLTLENPESSLVVYLASEAPEGTDPGVWGEPVAELEAPGREVTVEVDAEARYVLVWFTSVGGSGQRAGIAEATFVTR